GDTATATFTLANTGLLPLSISGFGSPSQEIALSKAAPFSLGWAESQAETLRLVASSPTSAEDSLVVASNDPRPPEAPLYLDVDVRALAFDTQVLGAPARAPLGIALDVVVTPLPSVRVERGTLFYRVAGATSFDSVAITPLATSFIATIPATAI